MAKKRVGMPGIAQSGVQIGGKGIFGSKAGPSPIGADKQKKQKKKRKMKQQQQQGNAVTGYTGGPTYTGDGSNLNLQPGIGGISGGNADTFWNNKPSIEPITPDVPMVEGVPNQSFPWQTPATPAVTNVAPAATNLAATSGAVPALSANLASSAVPTMASAAAPALAEGALASSLGSGALGSALGAGGASAVASLGPLGMAYGLYSLFS